jgi:hypothetical protein
MVKTKKKQGSTEIKIVTRRTEGQERIYSNYAEVTASPIDVSLRFADVKQPTKQEELEKIKERGEVEVSVKTEIVMPRDIAYGLMKALAKQLSNIESEEKETN